MAAAGLGAAIAGGKGPLSTSDREDDDFYPTPAEASRAIISRERNRLFGTTVWEPCGRGGAIMRVLEEYGIHSIGTDLVGDPENDVEQKDLFSFKVAPSKNVFTNPPFSIAEEMIRFLLDDLGCAYVAMLLKATFWHASTRTPLFDNYRPARIYALNWRPDFLGGGSPTMDCIWVVWDRLSNGPTTYSVIGKVANSNEPTFFDFEAVV